MKTYNCTTQAELDAALAKAMPVDLIVCLGSGHFWVSGQATVRAAGQATVRVSGQATVSASEQATVRAAGQATVSASEQATVRAAGQATVRAWGQATVRVSGQATVSASEQATVSASEQATVRAWGQATVSVSGQATVRASQFVTVSERGSLVSVEGGIRIPNPETAQEWCDFHAVEIQDDHAILFKAVRADYRSAHGMSYAPGTTPAAPDWDGGKAECGGGLHFVAQPWEGLGFDDEATRFIACPVLLSEIVVHPNPDYPNKVKAPRVALPCWECDIDGKPLPVPASEALTP